jgi:hypothetical protein
MTAEMCWDNENRTPMSGFYLDPANDLPVSGDVAHVFEPHPAVGELWTREAERASLVESSAAELHVQWPSHDPVRPVPACPECAAGKHGNCDGIAWDFVADEPTACPCDHVEVVPAPPIPEGLCGVGGCVYNWTHASADDRNYPPSKHSWER